MPDFLNLYNIFIAVSIFSTVLFVIKLALFVFVGGDAEVETDFNTVSECDISFNFLSTQSILAFFMGFGWSGLAALVQFKTGGRIALLIACIVGFAFMFLSAYLMYNVKKLNKRIVVDYNELVNKTGKAYTSFEANEEGQIEIDLNNKLTTLNAINMSDKKIDSFSIIKVIKVENNQIYITKG